MSLSNLEIEKLAQLLISVTESNIFLGIEILKSHPDAVPSVAKELLLIALLQENTSLKKEAKTLLYYKISKAQIKYWEKGFDLFLVPIFRQPQKDINYRIKNHELIREEFQPLIFKNPIYYTYYFQIAKEFGHNKSWYKSAEKYHKIFMLADPNHQDNLFYLAGVLSEDKKGLTEALSYYLKIEEQNPMFATVLHNIAIVYKWLNEYEKAYSYYHKAILVNPNDDQYQRNLASLCVYHFEEKIYKEEAKMILSQLIKIKANDSSNWLSWGNYLWLVEKDYLGVEQAYLKGIKLNPYNGSLMGNLAELYADILLDNKKALKWYKKGLNNYCSDYHIFNIISFYTLKLHDYHNAKTHYKKLETKNPKMLIEKDSFLSKKQWNNFKASEQLLSQRYPHLIKPNKA